MEHYILSEQDLALIRQRRGAENRLPGRFPNALQTENFRFCLFWEVALQSNPEVVPW
jgi:hypothetical protein